MNKVIVDFFLGNTTVTVFVIVWHQNEVVLVIKHQNDIVLIF